MRNEECELTYIPFLRDDAVSHMYIPEYIGESEHQAPLHSRGVGKCMLPLADSNSQHTTISVLSPSHYPLLEMSDLEKDSANALSKENANGSGYPSYRVTPM